MAREHRLKSVFPPGFDSSSSSSGFSGHYSHSTEQLYIALVDSYSPMADAELITVKSAWYGKQTDWAEHEFIVVQVEDAPDKEVGEKGLVNYLVLDRTISNASIHYWEVLGRVQKFFQGTKAADTFRVSYDGDVEKLLNDCGLSRNSGRFIEHIQFPSDKPLHLYELVALADVVSFNYPDYQAVGSNCFLFAGLIWDSLCELYPAAIRDRSLEKERGKYGWRRYTPEKSQVKETCEQASHRISQARLKIEVQKAKQYGTSIPASLVAMGIEIARPGAGMVARYVHDLALPYATTPVQESKRVWETGKLEAGDDSARKELAVRRDREIENNESEPRSGFPLSLVPKSRNSDSVDLQNITVDWDNESSGDETVSIPESSTTISGWESRSSFSASWSYRSWSTRGVR